MHNTNVFSNRLKILRQNKNFTIRDLAENSGVSKSAISKYEKGLSIPSIDNAIALSKVLNVKLSYLIGEDVNSNAKEDYIYSILQKHDLKAPFMDVSKLSTNDLENFERDIVFFAKMLKDKYKL